MIDIGTIFLLAGKEFNDSRRNRWFLLYAAAFAGLALALSWVGLSSVRQYGLTGFGRTSASMINLVLLIVPLMGISLGALSLAFERESGTLLYIMARPVTAMEVLAGKFLGLAMAMLSALLVGFGLSGMLIAWYGGLTQAYTYLLLVVMAFLLGLASLVLGLMISASVRRSATAVGTAVFLWIVLVVFGDLGLMGTALVMELTANQLFVLSLFNPLNVFKLAAILSSHGSLDMLGPAGQYAARLYGVRLLPMLMGLLAVWVVVPLGLTYQLFKRRGAV